WRSPPRARGRWRSGERRRSLARRRERWPGGARLRRAVALPLRRAVPPPRPCARVRGSIPRIPHPRTGAHAMDALAQYLDQHRDRFLDDLKAVLRIPSVSAQPQHKDDTRRCAEHMAAHLKALGMTRVEVVPTDGHPVLYAEWVGAPGKPTALVYGHYDVQPPE